MTVENVVGFLATGWDICRLRIAQEQLLDANLRLRAYSMRLTGLKIMEADVPGGFCVEAHAVGIEHGKVAWQWMSILIAARVWA